MNVSTERSPRASLWSGAAIAAALAAAGFAAQVSAQQSPATSSPTSQAEMQRGVPGIDVDAGVTRPPASTNGVPGLDVDISSRASGAANSEAEPDADTRTLGAAGATPPDIRPPIQDRN